MKGAGSMIYAMVMPMKDIQTETATMAILKKVGLMGKEFINGPTVRYMMVSGKRD